MGKFGVFIIEDEQEDYKKIKNILPSNCYSLLDSTIDVDESNLSTNVNESNLSEEELKAINIFKENQNDSLVKSERYVQRIIKNNLDNLRMIICDLEINGVYNGGIQVIGAIKEIYPTSSKDYQLSQQIPIIFLSKLTDGTTLEAFHANLGQCLYFPKEAAFNITSTYIVKDVIDYMVSDFDNKYKTLKFSILSYIKQL